MLSSKKDAPSLREEYWSSMRAPNDETTVHPYLYVEAKRQLDDLPTSIRNSNRRFNNFQNIGPTTGKVGKRDIPTRDIPE